MVCAVRSRAARRRSRRREADRDDRPWVRRSESSISLTQILFGANVMVFPEAVNSVDVLFVDEAGQMSLADMLAVSQAAETVVLLGDPQQLEQPTQGSHPDGVDTPALDHILGADHRTIPEDRGRLLEETWRLHPTICAFTSELFYEGRLHPRED